MEKESRAGKDFEELITRIETILAPKGAVIKSPDYIPDLITKSLREVDISIRFQDGSENRLITIECRDRVSQQDTTWIEQLITKQKDIGAWKTYAVSSGSFSKPAIEKAKHYGIEIRQFDQITDAEIAQEWNSSSSNLKLDIIAPVCSLIKVTITDKNDNEILLDELSEEFKNTLLEDLISENLLREAINEGDFNNILGQFVEPGKGEECIRFSLTLNYENEDLLAETITGKKAVSQIISDYSIQNRIVNVPIQSIQQYSSPKETIVQFLEGETAIDNNSIKVNVQGRFKPITNKTKRLNKNKI